MKYRVIVETDFRNRPKNYELSAAILVAKHFQTDVIFLRSCCQRTPDLDVKGIKWELKSPLGNGRNTIKNNLHGARKQSTNVIIDFRRMKMHQSKALANIRYYFASHRSRIRHLMVITKTEEIVEIF
ncbi:hypothetical protein IJH97_02085 [Candidatus Saccharibacteria bacterium]|nr:hypothetical protein [Candidatus Saccharibacteria bacterium]